MFHVPFDFFALLISELDLCNATALEPGRVQMEPVVERVLSISRTPCPVSNWTRYWVTRQRIALSVLLASKRYSCKIDGLWAPQIQLGNFSFFVIEAEITKTTVPPRQLWLALIYHLLVSEPVQRTCNDNYIAIRFLSCFGFLISNKLRRLWSLKEIMAFLLPLKCDVSYGESLPLRPPTSSKSQPL